jgi:hypothetical protein
VLTPAAFRKLALALPEAHEGSHMGHADFRVRARVFATLGYPEAAFAMVKLTPAQQAAVVKSAPGAFAPVPGGWGRRGATQVRLSRASAKVVRPALATAWENLAPRRLLEDSHPAPSAQLQRAYRRYLKRVLGLPGTSEATSYGTPSVKVKGKILSRWRTEAEGALALRCDFLDRQILLQADPGTFFLTDHYLNYPMVLVRLERLDAKSMQDLVERAWRLVAPRQLVRQWEEAGR